MLREIVTIDEDLCDGCGLCVPNCEEGALEIVNGKARLVAGRLCDGLGACLGHCPRGAIRIERAEAEAFSEEAVAVRKRTLQESTCSSTSEPIPSALRQWPVQLRLLPPIAPFFRGARLLVAADCVPFALADFHRELLRDHALVIACPKLDDTEGYVEKLEQLIRHNDLAEISVARMEVPCCGGILHAVLQARQLAGSDLPVNEVIVGVQGEILGRREIPSDPETAPGPPPTPCSMRPRNGGRQP